MSITTDSANASNGSAKERSNTRYLTLDGETKSIHEWAELSEIPLETIVKRLQRKWGTLEAIFCPIEDDEFILARRTICADMRKNNAMRKIKPKDIAMFNIWAAIMRRTGNESNIYVQAVAIARKTGAMPKGL